MDESLSYLVSEVRTWDFFYMFNLFSSGMYMHISVGWKPGTWFDLVHRTKLEARTLADIEWRFGVSFSSIYPYG